MCEYVNYVKEQQAERFSCLARHASFENRALNRDVTVQKWERTGILCIL